MRFQGRIQNFEPKDKSSEISLCGKHITTENGNAHISCFQQTFSNYSRTFWHHLYTQTNDSARGPIDMIVGTLDSRTRTRTSTRFDCPFLAKILRKFLTGPLIFLFVSSIGCSVILIAGNWAFSLTEKSQNCYSGFDLFRHDNIFAKPRTKMTTVSRFSRQNDAGLRALNVGLWENLVLVVVLVQQSKVP